ncbi:hypothetical protein D3C72_1896520 [compost metagenome]
MLQLTATSCSSSITGRAMLCLRRSSQATCSPSWSVSINSTMNSSPPRRATVSISRTRDRRRLATWISNWSPALWPRLSLTTLKRSMSMKASVKRLWLRAARAMAWLMRSLSRLRLGRPVRLSWLAWCSSSSW